MRTLYSLTSFGSSVGFESAAFFIEYPTVFVLLILTGILGAIVGVIEKTYRGKTPMTICQITEAGQAAFEAYREQLKNVPETMYK